MSDLMGTVKQTLAGKLARAREEVITQAITERLGTSDWMVEDLVGRLRAVRFYGRPEDRETYFLDNEPLVTIYPPQVELEGTKVVGAFNYVEY